MIPPNRLQDIGRSSERLAINFLWFYKLRWTAIAGQFAAIVIAAGVLDVEIPWQAMISIVAWAALSNIILGFFLNARQREGWHGWQQRGILLLDSVMVIDILFLTALMYLSGGPANPFTIFYLINISLAAVVLDARWAWMLGGLAFACFALLFWKHSPVEGLAHSGHETSTKAPPAHHHHGSQLTGRSPSISSDDPMHFHLQGMLVAFGAAAALIVYFITRVTTALTQREDDLMRARERKAHHDKFESLATLAAGAAHELATPLSTIAIITRELELDLQKIATDDAVIQSARTIRTEVDHCRRILDGMATTAGENVGEEIVSTTIGELIAATLAELAGRSRIRLDVEERSASTPCQFPVKALGQTIRAILNNALDASFDETPVQLAARSERDRLAIEIVDVGAGMSEETLARAGEPFYSTKEPGRGMGLGLFLAKRVVERLGGVLSVESRLGSGTKVTIEIPLRPVVAV